MLFFGNSLWDFYQILLNKIESGIQNNDFYLKIMVILLAIITYLNKGLAMSFSCVNCIDKAENSFKYIASLLIWSLVYHVPVLVFVTVGQFHIC